MRKNLRVTCEQLWTYVCTTTPSSPQPKSSDILVGITSGFTHTINRFTAQVYPQPLYRFQSVISGLYTVSTELNKRSYKY